MPCCLWWHAVTCSRKLAPCSCLCHPRHLLSQQSLSLRLAAVDGSVATMKIRRQDIVTAFGLDEYVEEAKKKGKAQGGKASGSGGGSAKKR